MVIGKRFDRIDRMGVIGCCVPIRWVKKFGLVEVFHAGVEQKCRDFLLPQCGRYSRKTKRERENERGKAKVAALGVEWGEKTTKILPVLFFRNSMNVQLISDPAD